MARRKSPTPPRSSAETGPAGTLRVIGGSMRGRPIRYLGDPLTRPMKQRVREAAFNLLGTRVKGTHVVDLFAGTGALTWEALSRGAVSATLFEQHFPSVRIIRQNARDLGVEDCIEAVAGDTFFWVEKRLFAPCDESSSDAQIPTDRSWLVFCSPPYELYVSGTQSMLDLIERTVGVAPPQSLIVVESDPRFDVSQLPACCRWDVREYLPAVLALTEIE